jgi:non-ribosomal peptide synthetase component F
LAGVSVPTPVPAKPAPGDETGGMRQGFRRLDLTAAELSALQAFARRHRLTVNTVAQAAWGLLLSHHADRQDVVFGATVSGRPPELPDVGSMIGMFINTLPVRLKFTPGDALAPWLQALQVRQVESRRYEYCSLTQIQTWCGVARGARLYDSLLAFHNFPGQSSPGGPNGGDDNGDAPSGTTGMGDFRAMSQLAYPLEMEVMPASVTTTLTLRYDSERVEPAVVERVLGGFAALLRGAGTLKDDATVGDLLEHLREDDRRRQATQEDAFAESAAKKLKGLRQGIRNRTPANPSGRAKNG